MMTLYDLLGVISRALSVPVAHACIKAKFLATGIFPYKDIFPDKEFLSSYVTYTPAICPSSDPTPPNETNPKLFVDESADPGPFEFPPT
jgi:hypothetical protein